MSKVIHSIHFPVSAKSFVCPIVSYLNQWNISSELWVENNIRHQNVLNHLNVPFKFVSSDLTFNPIRFLLRLNRFRFNLRKSRPIILHAHQTRAALIPLLAGYLEGVPIRIYHNHGLPYLGYQGVFRSLLRLLEKINIQLATHVLLVSHSNRIAAENDQLLPRGKGGVLANGSAVGIDLGTFEEYLLDKTAQENSKMALQVNHAKFVLGYVGRPVERKGFHLLLKAWQRSKLDPDKNVLLIAGCTREECEKILGYPVSNIHGLGYLGNLREFYAACDAITLPSQHEGFGYALLEGAAAGKPLLGSDIPGIRCAIQHNRTGLLVPVNDEIALADAIQKLANDRDLRVTLGKNARIHAEQEFSREMVLSKFLDFYRDLLKVD